MLPQPAPDQRRRRQRQPEPRRQPEADDAERHQQPRAQDHRPRPEPLGQPVAGQPADRHRQREDREGEGGDERPRALPLAHQECRPLHHRALDQERPDRHQAHQRPAPRDGSEKPLLLLGFRSASGSSGISRSAKKTVAAAKIGCSTSCWVRKLTPRWAKIAADQRAEHRAEAPEGVAAGHDPPPEPPARSGSPWRSSTPRSSRWSARRERAPSASVGAFGASAGPMKLSRKIDPPQTHGRPQSRSAG